MSLTMTQAVGVSRKYFSSGPLLMRKMQHWRPYICPVEVVLDFVPKYSSVLDIGCGSGLFLALLAGDGKCINGLGFDASKPAITTALEMAKRVNDSEEGSHLEFQHLKVDEPWPDGSFDVVAIVDVIHHIPVASQQEFFLKALSKVRPGGILIYKDLATRPFWMVTANRLHDLVLAGQVIHEVGLPLALRWANQRDASLLHQRRIDRKWYGHELAIFSVA